MIASLRTFHHRRKHSHQRRFYVKKGEAWKPKLPLTFDVVSTTVCNVYDVENKELFSDSRKREIGYARFMLVFICVHHIGMTQKRLCELLDKDRTTILYNYNTMAGLLESDHVSQRKYRECCQILQIGATFID